MVHSNHKEGSASQGLSFKTTHMRYAIAATALLVAVNIWITIYQHLKLEKKMEEQFNAVLQRIDDATNGIAEQLRDLKGQIQGSGLSSEKEAEILGKLESAAGKLEGIGANPENPTPEV